MFPKFINLSTSQNPKVPSLNKHVVENINLKLNLPSGAKRFTIELMVSSLFLSTLRTSAVKIYISVKMSTPKPFNLTLLSIFARRLLYQIDIVTYDLKPWPQQPYRHFF